MLKFGSKKSTTTYKPDCKNIEWNLYLKKTLLVTDAVNFCNFCSTKINHLRKKSKLF